jgi:hypothetical protein
VVNRWLIFRAASKAGGSDADDACSSNQDGMRELAGSGSWRQAARRNGIPARLASFLRLALLISDPVGGKPRRLLVESRLLPALPLPGARPGVLVIKSWQVGAGGGRDGRSEER